MIRKAAIMALLALVTGCGYQAGYVARDDLKRVAVPVFANDTFYRGIEIELTRQVITRMEKETLYGIVDSSRADAVLEGRILAYRLAVLQENERNNPTEVQMVLSVEATLRDARTGAVLSKATVREGDSFSTPAGEDELSQRALLFRRAAGALVERAFEKGW